MPTFPYKHDVFISHAVEDKIGIANDLCRELRSRGLKVWYSSEDIPYIGKLSQSITDAMNASQFAVVIFSPTYLTKDWTMAECYHFWARDGKEKPPFVVLPVYYQVTAEDVGKKILLLGDRFSINANKGVTEVADKIYGYVTKRTIQIRRGRQLSASLVLTLLLITLVAFKYIKSIVDEGLPTARDIEQVIARHIDDIHSKKIDVTNGLFRFTSTGAPGKFIDSVYSAYSQAHSHYRNEYEFHNGFEAIRAKKNVNAALQTDVESLSPGNNYGMDSATIVYTPMFERKVIYTFMNLTPVVREIDVISEKEDFYTVTVSYKNNIRQVEVSLQFPKDENDTKRHKMVMRGFKPKETYHVFRSDGTWKIREITADSSETNM